MTATNHTEHYELSQYTDNDHPTYTGDYNGDMRKIDAAIHAASQSGMTAVAHTNDLTGDGSDGNPLGVADTIARTEDIPSLDGYATTESVTQAIAAAIADRLTAGDIKPGSGINISTSGNQVTISYAGNALSAVAHDSTLTGDGTGKTPLGIRSGTAINPIDNQWDAINFNDFYTKGIYTFNGAATNGPREAWISGALIVLRSYQQIFQLCFYTPPPMQSQNFPHVGSVSTKIAADLRTIHGGRGGLLYEGRSTIMASSELSSRIIVQEVS